MAIPHEMVVDIRRAFARGLGLRAIAAEFGISHHTAKRYRPNGALCACGQPIHIGLCKAKHALSAAMVSRAKRQKGIDDGYRKPKPKSRFKEAKRKFDFVFGIEPNWQHKAKRQRPSEAEHYGIIGEVHHVTRNLRREYREDVRQEMILAAMEGRILRSEIALMVKPFLYREMKYWIGSFSSIFRSLNQLAGNRDGKPITFLDLLAESAIDVEDVWGIPSAMWWEQRAG